MSEEVKVKVTAETGVKPGYRTTEFYLSTAAAICGILMASGVIVEGSTAATIVGGVITVLASLGYTAARSKNKAAAVK